MKEKEGSPMTQTNDGVTRCHWPLWKSYVNLSVFTWLNNCPLLLVLWTQVDFQNWFPSILASQNLPLFETQHTS